LYIVFFPKFYKIVECSKGNEDVKIDTVFVLINTIPKQEYNVYNKLRLDPDFIEIEPLFGEFDLIAKFKGRNIYDRGKEISRKLRKINGVIDTKLI
jgi:hypothetical protein